MSSELSSYCAHRPAPEQGPTWLRAKEPAQYFGGAMLREIAIEEEMLGDFQTTFRLRIGGHLIAENMTDLETQFLVSEMLERIPPLRVVASDGAEQPLEQ